MTARDLKAEASNRMEEIVVEIANSAVRTLNVAPAFAAYFATAHPGTVVVADSEALDSEIHDTESVEPANAEVDAAEPVDYELDVWKLVHIESVSIEPVDVQSSAVEAV